MWHLKNVPKILHCYWGGNHLLYIRYLTIKTFVDCNPDWEVRLYYPKRPYVGQPSWNYMPNTVKINEAHIRNYLTDLYKLPIVTKEIDFELLGFAVNTPEVHKCDYMRINSMYQIGGVWSDMDIIYFRPLTAMNINTESNSDKETFVCISPDYGHSTGFNLAIPKSRFFEKLTTVFNEEYDPRGYQCWGPDIFNKYFKTLDSIPGGVNIDMDVVYSHDCHHVGELLKTNKPRFTNNSIGCHWYGGHPMWVPFLNATHGGGDNLQNNVIGNLLKSCR